MDIKSLFAKLRANAPSLNGELETPAPSNRMGIDEILDGSQRVAEENAELKDKVAQLEADAAKAGDTEALRASVNDATARAGELGKQVDALKQQVASLESERDGWRQRHEKLVLDFEFKVAAKVAELGIRGSTPEPAKAETHSAPLTGKERMTAAYEAQLQAQPVGGATK